MVIVHTKEKNQNLLNSNKINKNYIKNYESTQ